MVAVISHAGSSDDAHGFRGSNGGGFGRLRQEMGFQMACFVLFSFQSLFKSFHPWLSESESPPCHIQL